MTLSATCDIVPYITGGVCKVAKIHQVYIYIPCEILIIIGMTSTQNFPCTLSDKVNEHN